MRIARALYFGGAVAAIIAGYLITARTGLHAQQNAAVQVGANDIGGVVSSSKGPEAGVWVIAETTDLPTRYDQGSGHRRSRALPDSRSSQGKLYGVGPRLRPGGFAQGQVRTRQDAGPQAHRGAGHKDRRAILSRQLLVRAAARFPRKNEFPGTGPDRATAFRPSMKIAGGVAPSGQNR